MTRPIARADRRYRRKVLAIVALIMVVGACLIGWIIPWSREYLLGLEPMAALIIVKVALGFMFLSLIPFGLLILALGRRVVKQERFPPPGMKVIKDTKLIEGAKARLQGRVLIAFSLILILFALFGAVYFPYMISKLTSPSLQMTIQ